jgi:enoyl-CoA hydratase/carnithine racemase
MDLTQIRFDVKDAVGLVTLNRPERRNAYTPRMMEELVWTFGQADVDDRVRAVIVTGEGAAFCAGSDLAEGGKTFDTEASGEPVTLSTYRDTGGKVSLAIHRCRKPVIAAINGAAVGIGITMTLPMDIRIAAEDAKIGFVFARRGIVPEACSSWFLPRIVGISKASELCLTGRVFRARDEAHSGLFNYVVPSAEVLPKAYALAAEIAENTSAVSVALSRALLWHGLSEPDPQSAHLADSRCIYWCGQQPDAYEGIQAFLEKRPAKFYMSAARNLPEFYPWWKEPDV